MEIHFDGEALKMPDGMSMKAKLFWDYLEINKGGWLAAQCGEGAIIVTDESGLLSNAEVFPSEDDFIEWLERSAEDMLRNEPREILMAAGWINPRLLDDTIVGNEQVVNVERAVVDALRHTDEKEN